MCFITSQVHYLDKFNSNALFIKMLTIIVLRVQRLAMRRKLTCTTAMTILLQVFIICGKYSVPFLEHSERELNHHNTFTLI